MSQEINFPGQDTFIRIAKALLDLQFNTKAITAVVQCCEGGGVKASPGDCVHKHFCGITNTQIWLEQPLTLTLIIHLSGLLLLMYMLKKGSI